MKVKPAPVSAKKTTPARASKTVTRNPVVAPKKISAASKLNPAVPVKKASAKKTAPKPAVVPVIKPASPVVSAAVAQTKPAPIAGKTSPVRTGVPATGLSLKAKPAVSTPALPKAKPSPTVKKKPTQKTEAAAVKPAAAAETAAAKPGPTAAKPKTTPKSVAKSVIKAVANVFAKAEPKTEVTSETLVRRTFTRRKKTEAPAVAVPAILLEGDAPPPPPVSGPGEKFSLGAVPPAQTFPTAESELPESYGTGKLFLTARDPHWLYAHWDLSREQQLKLNAQSSDGHLVLRIYAHKIEGHPTYEIHVHPESRHWFTHVERAGNSYVAELGYYSALGKWTRISTSSGTMTPPDAVSAETDTDFATIPFEFPFAKLLELIKAAVYENLPLAQALEELRRQGYPDLPRITALTAAPPPAKWTPEQEQALAKIINIDEVRRVWMGSLEITELIRRKLAHEISSLGASQFGISSAGVSSLSSPFGGEAGRPKNFWFNVNAELIIYGATEPDAKVTLGGHPIKLRPDGSFSYRFALPDGNYDMPAVAVSADGTDARAAELKFSRATEYLGDVGAHPQDPALKPPLPESL